MFVRIVKTLGAWVFALTLMLSLGGCSDDATVTTEKKAEVEKQATVNGEQEKAKPDEAAENSIDARLADLERQKEQLEERIAMEKEKISKAIEARKAELEKQREQLADKTQEAKEKIEKTITEGKAALDEELQSKLKELEEEKEQIIKRAEQAYERIKNQNAPTSDMANDPQSAVSQPDNTNPASSQVQKVTP